MSIRNQCVMVFLLFGVWLSASFSAFAATPLFCGLDPITNTKSLQAAINVAVPGETLVLPTGKCVLAKCEVATGGAICYGAAGRHNSALHIGKKTNIALVGAADGTSVLKLDPKPPRLIGRHAYCPDSHVLSLVLSKFITLRGFTIDGSDGELPEDNKQCPAANGTSRAIAEHMHDVIVENSTDITIARMKLNKAHGDGLNLIADRNQLTIPQTKRIAVTDTLFLANNRAGITFQRNVGFVDIKNSFFRNSGNDQDIDMEATGGSLDVGPYQITIDNNVFERTKSGIAVTLGTSSTQRAEFIRFTRNTIRPASTISGGGCIVIYSANNTTITNNTVIGGKRCSPIWAQKVTGLVLDHNRLDGYANVQDGNGVFQQKAVIDIAERVVRRVDSTCGVAPLPACPYFIHYPTNISITNNTLTQHTKFSSGMKLSNADAMSLRANSIVATNEQNVLGVIEPASISRGIDLTLGVPRLSSSTYTNEIKLFNQWLVNGNTVSQFGNAIRLWQCNPGLTNIGTVSLAANTISSKQPLPNGIFLDRNDGGIAGFVKQLTVTDNRFSCGFLAAPKGPLLPNAFIRPAKQLHVGNIGSPMFCFL